MNTTPFLSNYPWDFGKIHNERIDLSSWISKVREIATSVAAPPIAAEKLRSTVPIPPVPSAQPPGPAVFEVEVYNLD